MNPGPLLLHDEPASSAVRAPDRVAIVEPGFPDRSYREVFHAATQLRNALQALGVGPGDRVGIYLPKSADAVMAILGALKAGAAYVPVDPQSPPARAAQILEDCGVGAVVTEASLVDGVRTALNPMRPSLPWIVLDRVGGGTGVSGWLDAQGPFPEGADVRMSPESPAYLLYTSGSTGKPKGVVVSHRAARSFVEWCSETFGYDQEDRFSSHAPFHFDLSIHDLFVSLSHGARVVLIGEDLGKDPAGLAALIERQAITIWYSTPTILSLLVDHGRLDRHDTRSVRAVLFAGEVFPIPRLRRLLAAWPSPRYFNLYGPTETNVCTWHEVRERELGDQPLPIGRVCPHFHGRVVEAGSEVAPGQQGELWIAGVGVLSGYWGRPDLDAQVFVEDSTGTRWYRTGDLVSQAADGTFAFHGRRDRMVKRRGYRIELGEIEAGLSHHPAIAQAAAVAIPDEASGVTIRAYLVPNAERPSLIDLKRYCMETLPRYMVPDRFVFLDGIPQTSTGKTDYQALKGLTSP